MQLYVSVSGDRVSLSAESADVDKVKAARRSWRRVARRVLRSKSPETRKKWIGRLKFISDYMTRRLQSVGKKKTASKKLRDQIDYAKKYLALYKRIIDALGKPYQDGMEKLADVTIPKPGSDIRLKKSDHKVIETPKKAKPKKPEEKPLTDKQQEAADTEKAEQASRKSLLQQRHVSLKKSVKEKFTKGVKIMGMFEKARDVYARTKSAEAKQKMELIAKRLGEIKTEIAEAKRRRDKFAARFKAEMA